MVIHLSSKAKSDEVNGIAKRAIEIIDNSTIQDKHIGGLNKLLKEAVKDLTAALNKSSGSDLTPLVQELERLRDKGLKCFFKTIYGACFRLNEEVEEAAKKLKKVIKRHGSTMYDLQQDQQTSKMASLFEELAEPDLVKAIELTSTQILLDETKQANQNYLTELNKRDQEEKETKNEKLVGESVKKTRVNLEKILNNLDSVLEVTEDQTYHKLFNDLEGIIEEMNAKIKARGTRKGNGEKGEE